VEPVPEPERNSEPGSHDLEGVVRGGGGISWDREGQIGRWITRGSYKTRSDFTLSTTGEGGGTTTIKEAKSLTHSASKECKHPDRTAGTRKKCPWDKQLSDRDGQQSKL